MLWYEDQMQSSRARSSQSWPTIDVLSLNADTIFRSDMSHAVMKKSPPHTHTYARKHNNRPKHKNGHVYQYENIFFLHAIVQSRQTNARKARRATTNVWTCRTQATYTRDLNLPKNQMTSFRRETCSHHVCGMRLRDSTSAATWVRAGSIHFAWRALEGVWYPLWSPSYFGKNVASASTDNTISRYPEQLLYVFPGQCTQTHTYTYMH